MKKKIICAIFGGFGNQILQYFFAASLAKKLNSELILDTSFSKISFDYDYYLKKNPNNLGLKNYTLDNVIIKNYTLTKNFFLLKYFRLLNDFLFYYFCIFFKKISLKKFYYEETYSNFSKNISFKKFQTDAYYYGYWQKILTSNELDQNIVKSFYYKKNKKKINHSLKLIKSSTVAIHIRGGDYNLLKNNHRWVCDKKYYLKAINQIKKKIKNPDFHIFTDDLNFAKNILNNYLQKIKIVFVKNYRLNDYEEFELLRNYKYYIISNSTFSLVASYLSQKKKIIIAPKYWFKNIKNTLIKKNKSFKLVLL